MRRRLMLVTLACVSTATPFSIHSSFAQTPDEQVAPSSLIESPVPTPRIDEPDPAESTKLDREDAVFMLGKLRRAVLASPNSADDRLKLAQGLYRIGDLDAARRSSSTHTTPAPICNSALR
jgi:hypothetical protein